MGQVLVLLPIFAEQSPGRRFEFYEQVVVGRVSKQRYSGLFPVGGPGFAPGASRSRNLSRRFRPPRPISRVLSSFRALARRFSSLFQPPISPGLLHELLHEANSARCRAGACVQGSGGSAPARRIPSQTKGLGRLNAVLASSAAGRAGGHRPTLPRPPHDFADSAWF